MTSGVLVLLEGSTIQTTCEPCACKTSVTGRSANEGEARRRLCSSSLRARWSARLNAAKLHKCESQLPLTHCEAEKLVRHC
jgi:hypothetical protein